MNKRKTLVNSEKIKCFIKSVSRQNKSVVRFKVSKFTSFLKN